MLDDAARLALAALLFLPSGRGALILVFGGLAMLPLSLLGSRLSGVVPWTAGMERQALRLGLGPCRILVRDRTHCIVTLAACRTCREEGGGPCDRERRALQLAIHARAPQAVVTELSCKDGRVGPCTFEIQRGHRA